MTYTLKRIGLNNPTEIEQRVNTDRIVVITKGLSVDEIVKEWRDCFCDHGGMIVDVDSKLLRTMKNRTLSNTKSVAELFYEQGVYFNEI